MTARSRDGDEVTTRGKELFRTLRFACEIDCLEDRGKKISSKKNRKTSTRLYGSRQTPSGSTCATFRNACTIRASFVIGSQPMIDTNLLRKRLDTVYPLGITIRGPLFLRPYPKDK